MARKVRRLSPCFKPGRVESRETIHFRLEVKSLAALESTGSAGDVAVGGNVELAVRERLVARIAGSGEVLYHGQPRVSETVTGGGVVRRAD